MTKTPVLLLLIFFIAIGVSLPIYQTGFVSDDNLNSLLQGAVKLFHASFWEYVAYDISTWLAFGRFFPLNVLSSDCVFYFFPAIHAYQVVRLLFIWLSVIAFSWLIKVTTKNTAASLLLFILFPLCWSIRLGSDPLVSFALFLPLLAITIAVTLGAFIKYCETNKVSWYLLALLMYACALALYELGIIILLLLLVNSFYYLNSWKKRILDLRYFFYLTVFYAVINIHLHAQHKEVYNGVQFKFSLASWPAFWDQASAALPFSYKLFTHLPTLNFAWNFHVWLGLTVIAMLMSWVVYTLLLKLDIAKSLLKIVDSWGVLLWLFPAFLIAINEKYQLLVKPGVGYILVYIQYFGMALLLISLLARLNSYLTTVSRYCLSLTLGLLGGFSFILNSAMVTEINNPMWNMRSLLQHALQQHFLAQITAGSTLVEQLYLWNNREFYLLNGNLQAAQVLDIHDGDKLAKLNQASSYLVYHHNLNKSAEGYVLSGKITKLSLGKINSTLMQPTYFIISQPRIFIFAQSKKHFQQLIADLNNKFQLTVETKLLLNPLKPYMNAKQTSQIACPQANLRVDMKVWLMN